MVGYSLRAQYRPLDITPTTSPFRLKGAPLSPYNGGNSGLKERGPEHLDTWDETSEGQVPAQTDLYLRTVPSAYSSDS
ncbi:hypothetical protein EVAR_64668_1 [Eumeta japonica]|uniref:Uncharacterized protein n=1 Tax=Eumeta variegata TaxID=151549 RepID=A0A4C1ZS48_EUMVA|nr:hypothetical protein EVAR_64668_1 [Eumeta japonica]